MIAVWLALQMFGLSAPGAAGAEQPYVYFDDFSTDMAMVHSYLHSELVPEPPEIAMNGVLMYAQGICGRSLYFYSGFLVDANAFLYYRFPLDDSLTGIDSGVVTFDVWEHTHQGGELGVSVSFEGAGGGFTDSIDMSGHYEYLLAPEEPCDNVVLHFEGGCMMIDNLSVTLYGSTPVSPASWGAIKSLLR